MDLSFLAVPLTLCGRFVNLSRSSRNSIRVCRSGAFRIILRSLIGLRYALDLRAVTSSAEILEVLLAAKWLLPMGTEPKLTKCLWEVALPAGLVEDPISNHFDALLLIRVEGTEVIDRTRSALITSLMALEAGMFVNLVGHPFSTAVFAPRDRADLDLEPLLLAESFVSGLPATLPMDELRTFSISILTGADIGIDCQPIPGSKHSREVPPWSVRVSAEPLSGSALIAR